MAAFSFRPRDLCSSECALNFNSKLSSRNIYKKKPMELHTTEKRPTDRRFTAPTSHTTLGRELAVHRKTGVLFVIDT